MATGSMPRLCATGCCQVSGNRATGDADLQCWLLVAAEKRE
jgi:hypothetical protein